MASTSFVKHTFASARAHNGEVYNAICDPDPGSERCAYLRVQGKRESLVYRESPTSEELVLAEDTYVLSPCFAGERLFWVDWNRGNWSLRVIRLDLAAPKHESSPFPTGGRPLSLSSCRAGDCSILTWEERFGKKTQVYYSILRDGEISKSIEVTDGTYNAYDPACCVSDDGMLWIIASVFKHGQYSIELFQCDVGATPTGPPVRLSNQAAACVHPSVCSRPKGGVWFSYTSYCHGIQDNAYVQDHHHRARKRFFEADSMLFAGIYDQGRTYACHTPPNPRNVQGLTAAMIVLGSVGADYSLIMTDSSNRVRLLARKHAPGVPIDAHETGAPIQRSANRPEGISRLAHPGIVLYTLENTHWSEPVCLIPNAHVAAPVSGNLANLRLVFAYTEDTRQTGWGPGAEWFDADGALAVGVGTLRLEDGGAPKCSVYPFRINPRPAPSIEELRISSRRNGFTHAMGQTHMHTNLSVCIRDRDRDPHLNYRFTQDVQHSDFGGTTDHAYNMWHTEMLITRKFAEYYYFPGDFVAIPAYEWTGTPEKFCSHEGGPWGHVNPLFLEESGDLEFYTPADPACNGGSLQRLYQEYRDKKILAPPHHVADYMHPYNWDFYFPSMQPFIEIFQDQRGSGEQPEAAGVSNWFHREEGHWAIDQLLSGRKFGFIGGADHAGIARAGVLVTELTRSALHEALSARRCFAATGGAMTIDFICNGMPMGSVVNADTVEFELNVEAISNLHELQIVRDGETVETVEATGTVAKYTWTVERKRDGEFWYVRILAKNGEVAWTSPIWIE